MNILGVVAAFTPHGFYSGVVAVGVRNPRKSRPKL